MFDERLRYANRSYNTESTDHKKTDPKVRFYLQLIQLPNCFAVWIFQLGFPAVLDQLNNWWWQWNIVKF